MKAELCLHLATVGEVLQDFDETGAPAVHAYTLQLITQGRRGRCVHRSGLERLREIHRGELGGHKLCGILQHHA